MKTIYFHFGMPKTGTTFIQNLLLINRTYLLQKDIYYPETDIEAEGVKQYKKELGWDLCTTPDRTVSLYNSARAYHNCFAKSIGSGIDNVEPYIKAFTKYPEKNIVISAERMGFSPMRTTSCAGLSHLEYMNKREKYLKELFSYFPMYTKKVIIYLRRQDHFIESLYSQAAKSIAFQFPDINTYIENFYPLYYKEILDQLATYIGIDNIIVRPFEKEQWIDNNLGSDFVNILGLRCNRLKQPLSSPAINNYGLSGEYLRLLEQEKGSCGHGKVKMDYLHTIRNRSYRTYNKFKPEPVYYMSKKERIKLLSIHEDGNRSIAKEYLNRKDYKLFYDDKLPDGPTRNHLTIENLSGLTSDLFMESQSLARRNEELLTRIMQAQWTHSSNSRPFVMRYYVLYREYKIIKKTNLFNDEYVRKQMKEEVSGCLLLYFLNNWITASINPNKTFDMMDYMKKHPHVMTKGLNPLAHFIIEKNNKTC